MFLKNVKTVSTKPLIKILIYIEQKALNLILYKEILN